jgi:hypothetical protein
VKYTFLTLILIAAVSCAPTQSPATLNSIRCEHPKLGVISTRVAVFALNATESRLAGQVVDCLKKLGWSAQIAPGVSLSTAQLDGAPRGVGLDVGSVQGSDGGRVGGVSGVGVLIKVGVQVIDAAGQPLARESFEQPGVGPTPVDAIRVAQLEGVYKASLIAHETLLANQ